VYHSGGVFNGEFNHFDFSTQQAALGKNWKIHQNRQNWAMPSKPGQTNAPKLPTQPKTATTKKWGICRSNKNGEKLAKIYKCGQNQSTLPLTDSLAETTSRVKTKSFPVLPAAVCATNIEAANIGRSGHLLFISLQLTIKSTAIASHRIICHNHFQVCYGTP
jgi:hypothetical protein